MCVMDGREAKIQRSQMDSVFSIIWLRHRENKGAAAANFWGKTHRGAFVDKLLIFMQSAETIRCSATDDTGEVKSVRESIFLPDKLYAHKQ